MYITACTNTKTGVSVPNPYSEAALNYLKVFRGK